MTPAGKSLFYFGIYGICAGFLFIIMPDTLTSFTYLPALPSGWGRMIGFLALVIGTYDIVCGKAGFKPFIMASIYVRLGFMFYVLLLVVFGQMPKPIILLGAIDALGALWTAMALKSEVIRK